MSDGSTVEECPQLHNGKCKVRGDYPCCWHCKHLKECVKKWILTGIRDMYCREMDTHEWCSRVLAQWKREGEPDFKEKVIFT